MAHRLDLSELRRGDRIHLPGTLVAAGQSNDLPNTVRPRNISNGRSSVALHDVPPNNSETISRQDSSEDGKRTDSTNEMNGNNGWRNMSAGSTADMVIAYVFRGVSVVIQGVLVLMAYALFNLVVAVRDDMRDVKKDIPAMQKDIGELKEQGKAFATKAQLESAEQRVKNEFTRQLEEQIKNNKLQTKEKMNYAR